MCGRMVVTRSAHEIAELFDLVADPEECELGPRYNVAPSQDIMAIRMRAGEGRGLSLLHWGLIPSWAKQRSIAYRMINARSETAHEKPAFRRALRARRCIVPADGFYEWQQPAAPESGGKAPKKVPHYFRHSEAEALAIAGLWETWTDRATGEVVESCTLLTTEANKIIVGNGLRTDETPLEVSMYHPGCLCGTYAASDRPGLCFLLRCCEKRLQSQ